MSTITARTSRAEEVPFLRCIWKNTFGSIGEESFFLHYYKPGLCIIAECNGTPAATGYLIPFGDVLSSDGALRCAMIYSVATLPEYRGKGLGTAVVNSLINLAFGSGYPAVVLCPHNDGLFEYYSKRTGLRDWFFINKQIIKKEHVNTEGALPEEVSANKYHSMRENLLKGTVHIKHDLSTLEYQVLLCGELGGGLFRVGEGCAVVERQQDGAVWIKELLLPESGVADVKSGTDITNAISSIAKVFPADEYIVRLPSFFGKGSRFGMLVLNGSINDDFYILNKGSYAPWYGMAFD